MRVIPILERIKFHFSFRSLINLVMLDCSKEIVEILLENGAKVNCYDKSTNTTAIQMAVIRGNIATVQLLVAYGADTKVICKVI